MREIIIATITAFISFLGTYLGYRGKLRSIAKEHDIEKSRLKNELTKISNEHIIEINKLQNQQDLKDKDMEAQKLKHELMEKSKETDCTNPLMIRLFEESIANPEETSLKLEKIQNETDRINRGRRLQG